MTNIKGTYIELYNSEKVRKDYTTFYFFQKLYDALDMQKSPKTEKES